MAREVIAGGITGPIAGHPYADKGETPGKPVVIEIPDIYREFLATDPRSLQIVMHPHHWNFILNPSLRTATTGWSVTAAEGTTVGPGQAAFTAVIKPNDAAANQAAMDAIRTANPSPGGDGQVVKATETGSSPLLKEAVAWYDATSTASDRLYDLSGNNRDAVFGAGANSPVVLPWVGANYAWLPQDTMNANYINLGSNTYSATDTIEFDVDLLGTTGVTWLIYSNTTANGTFFMQFNGTSLTYRLWWGGTSQDYTWNTVRVTGRHTYRFVRTTTTVELFVDNVSSGVKTFTQAVPSSNAEDVFLGLTGTASSTERLKFYSAKIGTVAIMDPANVAADHATIGNSGTAGGNWNITRAATGNKIVVVNKPVVYFAGAQYAGPASFPSFTQGTAILAIRSYADNGGDRRYLRLNSSPNNAAGNGLDLVRVNNSTTTNNIVYKGTDANTAANYTAAHGPRVVGSRLSATTLTSWVNGSVVATDSTLTSGVQFSDGTMALGSTTYTAMELLAVAVWDRALTDAEMVQAMTEIETGGTDSQDYYLTLAASPAKVLEADVPFPTTGDLVGYKAWVPLEADSIDTDESWVGRSMHLSGSGTIRFKDPNGPFVYVGPTVDLQDQEWYEPGRGSAQWTYSAYVMGPCQVRLLMDAYYPQDIQTAHSPPEYQNLPQVADPLTAPYDAAKPAIQHATTGEVWVLKGVPYYEFKCRPPSVADPTVVVPDWEQPEEFLIKTSTGELFRTIFPYPDAAPYYALVGLPVTKDAGGGTPWDPTTAAPGDPLVKLSNSTNPNDAGIGEVWELSANHPGWSYYEPIGRGPESGRYWSPDWIDIPAGQWTRVLLQTSVRYGTDEGNSFLGCTWIDARLEFRNAEGARFSSFMLDPTEHPVAQYFDGSMTEDAVSDDFMWERPGAQYENASVSEYYYDRLARVRFLHEQLRYHVPLGRPYQIYFGTFDDPYVPTATASMVKGL